MTSDSEWREAAIDLCLAESMAAPQSPDHPWDRGYRAGAAACWAKLKALAPPGEFRTYMGVMDSKPAEAEPSQPDGIYHTSNGGYEIREGKTVHMWVLSRTPAAWVRGRTEFNFDASPPKVE